MCQFTISACDRKREWKSEREVRERERKKGQVGVCEGEQKRVVIDHARRLLFFFPSLLALAHSRTIRVQLRGECPIYIEVKTSGVYVGISRRISLLSKCIESFFFYFHLIKERRARERAMRITRRSTNPPRDLRALDSHEIGNNTANECKYRPTVFLDSTSVIIVVYT